MLLFHYYRGIVIAASLLLCLAQDDSGVGVETALTRLAEKLLGTRLVLLITISIFAGLSVGMACRYCQKPLMRSLIKDESFPVYPGKCQ